MAALIAVERGQDIERLRDRRMIRAGVFFLHGDDAFEQRLDLIEAALRPVDRRQQTDSDCHIGMVGAELLFSGRQRALRQGRSLVGFPRLVVFDRLAQELRRVRGLGMSGRADRQRDRKAEAGCKITTHLEGTVSNSRAISGRSGEHQGGDVTAMECHFFSRLQRPHPICTKNRLSGA